MAEFDLTSKVAVYLDRHLVFPLLEFISSKDIYDASELSQAKLSLLSGTNMVDFAMDVFETLHPDKDVPDYLVDKRSQVVEDLQSLQEQVIPIISILDKEAVTKKIQESRDSQNLMRALETEHEFKPEMLMRLYKFAKLQYECGNYSGAAEYLYFVRALFPPGDKNLLNAMWGKLASEILMQSWDVAMDDLGRLKEYIDSFKFPSALMALEQRSWLIHWSLFVYFNHQKGRDAVIDRFLYEPQYLNAIQSMCPHILRYLTTAVITSKRRRNVLKDLVRVIQQESYTYKDPITEFIECLYVNFDFDGAQKKLRECEVLLTNDFFLVGCLDEFIDNARLFIFETFCRIHQCISIDMLAEKLNMGSDEAEKWIVNLIRNARLDAKIDSKLGHVVMGTPSASPYQQLIEKTKGLAFRSQMLAVNIEKRLGARGSENVPTWAVPAQDF